MAPHYAASNIHGLMAQILCAKPKAYDRGEEPNHCVGVLRRHSLRPLFNVPVFLNGRDKQMKGAILALSNSQTCAS